MATTTTEKPRYLGLLNAISLAESQAGVYLEAWANATCDEDLACTLRLVAAREKSHGEVFCRRLAELGYPLRHKSDPGAHERIARYANPKISDVDKISRREVEGDPFGEIEQKMKEGFYDPMTCNLLAWYICEERDSGKRLRECYDHVCAKAEGRSMKPAMTNGNGQARTNGQGNGMAASGGPSDDAKAIMACMTDGFARLEKCIAQMATD
jgi:hypothetical protein